MTLTRRLTMLGVGWMIVVLALFNVVFLSRVKTESHNAQLTALQLELSDVWHLNEHLSNLNLSSPDWEDATLLYPSAILFYDPLGNVTSYGATQGFSADSFKSARAKWKQAIVSDIEGYVNANKGQWTNPAKPSGAISSPASEWVRQLPAVNGSVPLGPSEQFVGMVEPFSHANGTIGAVVVASMATAHTAMAAAMRGLLWTDVPILLLAGIGTYWVTHRGLEPIKALIDNVRGVEWSLMSRVHVDENAPMEIRTLASSLNQLLDEVDNSLHEQRRFIADASHELRTPLSIISGHANVLRRWGKTRDEVWEPAVRHIVNEAARMQALVDNLLLLAQLDAGEQQEFAATSAEELKSIVSEIREDGELLRPDLAWDTKVLVYPLASLHIPPNSLHQVLMSLVENSMKHTESGGRVRIAATVSEEAHLSVIDSGAGIAPEDLPHVFDRFRRGKLSTANRVPGAGLGLAISKELIEAYGGRIEISSELGHGTRVHLVVPLVSTEEDEDS